MCGCVLLTRPGYGSKTRTEVKRTRHHELDEHMRRNTVKAYSVKTRTV